MKGYSSRRRKKKKTQRLPHELITEILLRLPVKSLLRFKTVCKSWLSLISDPHFAISHYELGAACTERLLLVKSFPSEILSIDFNASLHDDSAYAVLNSGFMKQCPFPMIKGSCRGFLLLVLENILCLWNPSTGVHKFVPWPHTTMADKDIASYGFGYDSSKDDYLVVIAFTNLVEDRLVCMDYFSLRANKWKQIKTNSLPYGRWNDWGDDNPPMPFLNNAIHWLAFRYDILIPVIVAFDLTHKSFSEIPLPIGVELCLDSLLNVTGKMLNLRTVGLDYRSADIWVMKEYNVQSSWTKTIVVSFTDIPAWFIYPVPVCYTESGDVLGVRDIASTAILVKCNDKGQLQEHRCYFYDSDGSPAPVYPHWAVYTETLLSLPCDNQQAQEVD